MIFHGGGAAFSNNRTPHVVVIIAEQKGAWGNLNCDTLSRLGNICFNNLSLICTPLRAQDVRRPRIEMAAVSLCRRQNPRPTSPYKSKGGVGDDGERSLGWDLLLGHMTLDGATQTRPKRRLVGLVTFTTGVEVFIGS